MAISPISNISATNKINQNYQRLTSGKKINSAADNAAGLAIAEKLQAQINGFDKGIDNTLDMKNLTRTAEGGLSTINDGLQRIRELAIQASSGILTNEDKALLQNEVDQIKDHIKNSSDYTEFNRIKLLDGSFADMNTASNPNGTGMKITIDNATLSALGIENFDLTGNFDISQIDNAIEKVSSSMSKIGAMQNTFDYTVAFNSTASINLAAAKSSIADADMAREVTELKKNQILQQYQMFVLKSQNENKMRINNPALIV